MKSKADGWLFVIAVLAIAAALFAPLPALGPSLPLPEKLKLPVTFVSVLAWFLAVAGFWGFKTRFWPRDSRECRRLIDGVFLLVLQAIILRAAFELVAAWSPFRWPWLPKDAWVWVPWFLTPGLATILLGGRVGVLVCLADALMLYLLAAPGPWPVIGC